MLLECQTPTPNHRRNTERSLPRFLRFCCVTPLGGLTPLDAMSVPPSSVPFGPQVADVMEHVIFQSRAEEVLTSSKGSLVRTTAPNGARKAEGSPLVLGWCGGWCGAREAGRRTWT